MADICYKHIRDKRKETTLLDVVFSEGGQPVSVDEQLSMLHEVYNRITQAGDSSAQASKQQIQQAADKTAAEELAASAVPHAGDPGVVTMPVGSKLTLEQLWSAWEPKKPGEGPDGLRIYKAESLYLYPSDQARRHQMRWLQGKDDMNRFDQYKHLFHTLDRLVRKKSSSNRVRDANSIMKNWRISLVSAPTCPINTVASLATALKQYADGKTVISGASGGQKMQADGTMTKQLTRERLEFFFQLA